MMLVSITSTNGPFERTGRSEQIERKSTPIGGARERFESGELEMDSCE
jgi:hypothetical protein